MRGVGLDELFARGHMVAHQHREGLVSLHGVLDRDLEDHAVLRIERRVPELLGVHLTEALVSVDRDAFASERFEVIDELVDRLQLDRPGFRLRDRCRRAGDWRLIADANGIEDPRRLVVGTFLNIPPTQ